MDLNKKHWFITIKFNLQKHAEQMKAKHNNWSEKQCRCVLYWQNSVRKTLKNACIKFCNNNGRIFTLIPEGMGVYVIKTAKRIGIPIQTKPKDIIFKIALIGYPNKPIQTLEDYFPLKSPTNSVSHSVSKTVSVSTSVSEIETVDKKSLKNKTSHNNTIEKTKINTLSFFGFLND